MRRVGDILAAAAAGAFGWAGTALHAQSPLDVVLDGRAAADSSNLTEEGIESLMISAGNITLLIAGLFGIMLVASGIWTLWRGSNDADPRLSRAGWPMIVIGGLMTIPAIVAAIVPYALGV